MSHSPMTIVERFWAKVDKTPSCWNWTASKKRGYGAFRVGSIIDGTRRLEPAHRFSWELSHGTIPEGLIACHHCDNPSCVRPDHLFLGTHRDNAMDKSRKGRCHDTSGDRSAVRKLCSDDVVEIRRLSGEGIGPSVLARLFSVTPQHVCAIKRGAIWSEGTR